MNVIVINGPMGIGKTTVGTYIADSNPGTAFIDGDWCMDLHPFVGNKETRDMAVNNIRNLIYHTSESRYFLYLLLWFVMVCSEFT